MITVNRRLLLIALVGAAFIGLTIYGVVVTTPTLLFDFLLIGFTILVIGLAPWLLGR